MTLDALFGAVVLVAVIPHFFSKSLDSVNYIATGFFVTDKLLKTMQRTPHVDHTNSFKKKVKHIQRFRKKMWNHSYEYNRSKKGIQCHVSFLSEKEKYLEKFS
jgi:hypothetical protein